MSVVIIDVRNSEDPTRKVMEEESVTATVLLDDKQLSSEFFEIIGTPTTLLVDARGRAVFRHIGYADHMQEMMSAEIEALLSKPEPM